MSKKKRSKEKVSPTDLHIKAYFHCSKCLDELEKAGRPMSPKDYSRTQTGFTPWGIQVWCNRHNCNVIHINFEGRKHPAV